VRIGDRKGGNGKTVPYRKANSGNWRIQLSCHFFPTCSMNQQTFLDYQSLIQNLFMIFLLLLLGLGIEITQHDSELRRPLMAMGSIFTQYT
jgi:tellurite resistance protein TehA-like permease